MKPNVSLPLWIQLFVLAWTRPQLTLPKVGRWSKYVKRGTRRQDTLQHTMSLLVFASRILPEFRPYVDFDESLLFRAFLVHDFGEGETKGGDTLYIDKSRANDLEETRAFMARYGVALGAETANAFLLQFAKNARQMGGFAGILQDLGRKHPTECLLFNAIECFDYFLYALEQYLERRKVKILVQILRNTMPHFERLARDLPGFTEVLWQPELADWCNSFLACHEGKWIEQKGER